MNELGMAVVAARCIYDKRLFGMSFRQKKRGEWLLYWTFPLTESTSSREGYDKNRISGDLAYDDGCPGCPYCNSDGIFSCPQCDHITCQGQGNLEYMTCSWCGYTARIGNETISNISGSGDI